jgi:hypothetical protein
MVHFPGLARTRLCIQRAVYWFYQYGFPHSDIPGSKPVCGSPKLFAAYHVLHRLLAPRHPPYALSSLTIKLTQHAFIVTDESPEKFVTQSLASPGALIYQGEVRRTLRRERSAQRFAKASSPSHKRYSRAKLAVLLRHANLDIRATHASFLQLSKIVVPLNKYRSERLRSRRSAISVWSRKREKALQTIKNPATSAGRIRPSPGALVPRAFRTDVLEARFISTRYS